MRAPRGALIDSGETVRAQPEVAGRERCFEEATRPTIPNRPTPRVQAMLSPGNPWDGLNAPADTAWCGGGRAPPTRDVIARKLQING
jgi:hypothetical protein